MTIKFVGAMLVIIGCGGFGFLLAATHRAEERTLRCLITVFDMMECELRCRLTPLPDLCRIAGATTRGALGCVFRFLAEEMDRQVAPNVEKCMQSAMCRVKDLPKQTNSILLTFGKLMGRFDIDGQLQGIETVRTECKRALEIYSKNQDVRLRSYQTLALCAGAAIVILFI